jgi:hypothetical protein
MDEPPHRVESGDETRGDELAPRQAGLREREPQSGHPVPVDVGWIGSFYHVT